MKKTRILLVGDDLAPPLEQRSLLS